MDITLLGPTLLAVFGFAVVFGFLVSRIEGLALFAPRSTKRLDGSAAAFCAHRCRADEGLCPLTGTVEPAPNCPLWRFVEADMPTALYGNPFEPRVVVGSSAIVREHA